MSGLVSNYFRSIKLTTDSVDYEILQNADVKAAIMEKKNMTSEQYDEALAGDGFRYLNIIISGNGFKVSLNNDNYYDLWANKVFFTDGYTATKIKSVRINTSGVTLYFGFEVQ